MPPVAPPLPGIAAADREALARLVAADPVLVDCVPAGEALGLGERVVLHAGPRIHLGRDVPAAAPGRHRRLRHEGWAATDEAAARLASADGVRFEPCHDHAAVGPTTGLVTRSMPVFVVENRAFGNRAHATINEGLGGVPVVETGITPLINTGIPGRRAGSGQVGAGTVRAPLGCFTAALEALARARGAA
jgi:Protein of unknown function (DUF1116)